MSSADFPGTDPERPDEASEPTGDVDSQLVEALMHLLIEKGVLTKNDALSVVQTVVQVQRGAAVEGRHSEPQTEATVQLLKRMYRSFEAVTALPSVRQANWDNVRQLRPPVHSDRPEFPADD